MVKSEASEENYWEQINWPHVRRRVTNEKLPLVDHTAARTVTAFYQITERKDHSMIGQILSSVTGLATSWLDSKETTDQLFD
ncbi:MAG: hypothetical protein EBW61_10635 [Rhodobacteraceae bacterium]|nr:hypothetical protein [Paracoccaceae bacterium]